MAKGRGKYPPMIPAGYTGEGVSIESMSKEKQFEFAVKSSIKSLVRIGGQPSNESPEKTP